MRVRGAAATDMAVGAKLAGKGTVPFMLVRSAVGSRERIAQELETTPLKGVAIGPSTTKGQ
jgi:galactokinase/mevalonate kinase-like predicted kinase